MASVGRYGRCAVAHGPVHLAHVPHVRPVRVDVRLGPRVRRHAVRPIANPLPLAEVQCGPVKHVTVPHREAVRDAHGQPADKHARQMLRGPEVVVVQMLRGQHARHEAGVVRVQQRGKDDLLAACVKVRPQCVDLGPDGARTGGAAVQRHPVDAVRLGVDDRAQKLLQIEAEYHQVQYQRVAQHEQMDVARLLVDLCAAANEGREHKRKERVLGHLFAYVRVRFRAVGIDAPQDAAVQEPPARHNVDEDG
uniref:Uncharacterized protein n=1 Tax=Anopheles coluzzii TaxID=1518534 RepID=A0A8W7PHW8_ANOCL